MGLCLLCYVCELGVEFLNAFACYLRVWGLQGLFQGGPQYAPQVLGVGPAAGPGVVPPVGVLDLYLHDVSCRGSSPALLV